MGKQAPNWATFSQRRRTQQRGTEDARDGASEGGVIRSLFEQQGDRNARLRHYLETGPRGERDVEALLDARMGDRLPSGQTRADRDTWLRGILDSW